MNQTILVLWNFHLNKVIYLMTQSMTWVINNDYDSYSFFVVGVLRLFKKINRD